MCHSAARALGMALGASRCSGHPLYPRSGRAAPIPPPNPRCRVKGLHSWRPFWHLSCLWPDFTCESRSNGHQIVDLGSQPAVDISQLPLQRRQRPLLLQLALQQLYLVPEPLQAVDGPINFGALCHDVPAQQRQRGCEGNELMRL